MKQPFRKITQKEQHILFHIGFSILLYCDNKYKEAHKLIKDMEEAL